MFKRTISFFLAGALALGLSACGAGGSGDVATDSGSTGNQSADDTFIVGFDAEYAPFGYMGDDGEYTGFDLELAQEVSNRMGWELVKQPINWDSKDMEINSGAIDCIWNGFTMTGRETEYEWTVPYVDNSIVVAVKADSDIKTLADLAGKSVMVQADSSALAALEGDAADLAATFGSLEQISDYNVAFMTLESGAVDAIAVDVPVANHQAATKPESFRILDEEVAKEQYAVGFKLGNTELRDAVEQILFEMLEDGTFDTIAAKYEEYDIPNMLCLE